MTKKIRTYSAAFKAEAVKKMPPVVRFAQINLGDLIAAVKSVLTVPQKKDASPLWLASFYLR